MKTPKNPKAPKTQSIGGKHQLDILSMEFEKRKAAVLASMSSPEPDKSPKGDLDTPIIPLLNALNQHPSYFTTSSCSGRITILSQPPNNTTTKKKARGGGWLFITHDVAEPNVVVDILYHKESPFSQGDLVFRFEPFIVAVECKDVHSANDLVSTAISCGFRESGITSMHKRIMVAVRSSIRMEVPLGEIGRIMVSPEYIHYLVGVANEKMVVNRKRTDIFLQVLQQKASPGLVMVTVDNCNRRKARLGNGEQVLDLEAKQLDILSKITALEKNVYGCTKIHTSRCQKAVCAEGKEADGFWKSSTKDIVQYDHDDCNNKSSGQSTEDKGIRVSCKSSTNGMSNSCQLAIDDLSQQRSTEDVHLGLLRDPGCCLAVVRMMITGEPIEKLFLWGHSACTLELNNTVNKQILVFGGFGGLGRHARRNESLMLDPLSGSLEVINAEGPPSPRLGHTSSVIGKRVFVIGGRGDPTQILNDVWVLDAAFNGWNLLQCTGSVFPPRHRHAAAVVGSKIFVFGGLNNEKICSCMHILETETLQWSEVNIQGEWPSARHSHSMVADGSRLYMFGGYDGENVLGDLYSFDVETFIWKKQETIGRTPFARFSHSMFVYKSYLGIVGGCPVKQQAQDMCLLDLRSYVWKHVTVHTVSKDLLVRSTTSVLDDNLVILGGGASCYAFGTKFNEPMRMNLYPLAFPDEIPLVKDKPAVQCNKVAENNMNNDFTGPMDSVILTPERMTTENNRVETSWKSSKLDYGTDMTYEDHVGTKHLVLQLGRKYAKLGKDLLKKIGWLDLGRKVYASQDGVHICLPITEICYAFFQGKAVHSVDAFDAVDKCRSLGPTGNGFTIDDASFQMLLNLLLACGGSVFSDDVASVRKASRPPQKILKEAVHSLIMQKGLPLQLLEQLPTRWDRIGDMMVLPVSSFKDPIWDSISEELWPTVAKSLGTKRLARQGRVVPNGTRDSTLEILVGDTGWVEHHENGIVYSFDATKCMFSLGNLSEKLRMAQLDCRDEVIVDLFAGIGYFVLPFLLKANAKLVYACEWNPHAIEALQHNIQNNSMAERCIILEGDNRITAPKGIADRVCLGLLPSSESSWPTAVRALRTCGGILHVHGNVKDSEESSWSEYVARQIDNIAKSEGYFWDVSVHHIERVKWYGPHIHHLVADVRCKQMQM